VNNYLVVINFSDRLNTHRVYARAKDLRDLAKRLTRCEQLKERLRIWGGSDIDYIVGFCKRNLMHLIYYKNKKGYEGEYKTQVSVNTVREPSSHYDTNPNNPLIVVEDEAETENNVNQEAPLITEAETENNVKPGHYKSRSGKELFEVFGDFFSEEELRGVMKSNVIKYVIRSEKKNGIEDLKKARHYLDMYIKFAEKDNSPDHVEY
jgi:hypothetical protein